MNAIRILSKLWLLIPIGMLIYDLVKGWFVDAEVKVRSLREWWMWLDAESLSAARSGLVKIIATPHVDKMLDMPGALVLLVPSVVLYAIYRLCRAIFGADNNVN